MRIFDTLTFENLQWTDKAQNSLIQFGNGWAVSICRNNPEWLPPGYGIYEIMSMNDKVNEGVTNNLTEDQLEEKLREIQRRI